MRRDTSQRKRALAGLRAISGQDEMLGTLVRVISSGKQALDAVMLEMGRMVAESIMLEREEVAGPDYYPTDPAFKKWAHEKGSLYLGDQKVHVTRPRLRHVAQGEVTLHSFARLRAPGRSPRNCWRRSSAACQPRSMPRPSSRRPRPWGCRLRPSPASWWT